MASNCVFAFFSDVIDAGAAGLELLIPPRYIQMEENTLGFQLGVTSEHGVKVKVQTVVVSCMYWDADVEQWTNFGCWVSERIA